MNKYLSIKLNVISFFSMVMVVFLHSYNVVVNLNTQNIELNRGYSSFFQDFFSQGITRIAVPLFFLISGYLFFLNIKGAPGEFISKFKKRLKTIVLPYLFWSVWGLLLFFILQTLPQSKNFFTNELIRDYSVRELLATIFLDPSPYQLWFIRDLIVLIFLSPILYYLIRSIKYATLLVFLFAWLGNFNFIVFSNESLLFFGIGAFLGIENKNLFQIGLSAKAWIYIYLWIAMVLSKTILVYLEFQNTLLITVLHKSGILIGILAIWSLYDNLFKNKDFTKHKIHCIFSFSFFLFVFH